MFRTGRSLRILSGCAVAAALLLFEASSALAHLCLVRQGRESAGAPEAGDRYGRAVAAGDFNGDGYEDLAAGATGENEDIFGSNEHGAVIVSYGSARGITHVNADYLSIGAPADPLVRFGFALAAGDFDDDGFDDLAVGAPEADAPGGINGAGMVGIFYGGPGGLSANPDLALDESDAGAAIEAGDRFGCALACGDFNLDGHDDLAVGGYGEDAEAGAIYFFYGNGGGLGTGGAGWMKQSTLGFAGTSGDWFGWSLAAGDVVGGPQEDLVVGAPRKAVTGLGQAGQYYVIRGGATGLLTGGALAVNAMTLGLDATAGAYFGYSLALGQFFDTEGALDLAVGEPRYHTAGVSDAGRVVVIEYESIPAGGPAPVVLVQSDAGGQLPEANDQFGFALAGGDWNADGYDDLAVGSPYEGIVFPAGGVVSGAGIVQLFLGSDDGPFGTDSLTYDAEILNDDWGLYDYLGQSVAFGRFDDSPYANLAVGAPGKDFQYVFPPNQPSRGEAGCVFVVAPWRQEQKLGSWSSIAVDCEGSITFSQKPFDEVRQASTTKAMTLLLASEWSRPSHPRYDPDYTDTASVYTVPSWVADPTKIGGSLAGLKKDQKISLAGLMKAMITVSGNEAAFAIADHVTGGGHAWSGQYGTCHDFVIEMNDRALELGMTQTHFTQPKGSNDPSDLPPAEEGAHTTAYDFALLGRAVMENELAAMIVGETTWMVPSRKLVAPATYQWSVDKYDNGFLMSVRNRVGSAGAGVKGGKTSEALNTGIFAAAKEEFSFGAAIATSFRNPSSSVMHDQASELLEYAMSECLAPPDFAPPPQPPDDPLRFALPGIPSHGDSLWGGVFAPSESGDESLAIDLLAQTLAAGPASVRIEVARYGTLRLAGPAASATIRLARFESHEGVAVRNSGQGTAAFLVMHSGASTPESVVLRPGESWSLPPYAEPGAAQYFVAFSAASADTVELDVAVEGWRTPVTVDAVGRGIPGGPLRLETEGTDVSWWGERVAVSLAGLDTAPGNLVTLVVTRHGVSATHVEDDPRGLDGAGTASPVFRPVALANFPNPFQPETTIEYVLPRSSEVSLAVFDVAGRCVRSLAATEPREAGLHRVRWDGRDERGREAAAGVYFARLVAGGAVESARMVLMR